MAGMDSKKSGPRPVMTAICMPLLHRLWPQFYSWVHLIGPLRYVAYPRSVMNNDRTNHRWQTVRIAGKTEQARASTALFPRQTLENSRIRTHFWREIYSIQNHIHTSTRRLTLRSVDMTNRCSPSVLRCISVGRNAILLKTAKIQQKMCAVRHVQLLL